MTIVEEGAAEAVSRGEIGLNEVIRGERETLTGGFVIDTRQIDTDLLIGLPACVIDHLKSDRHGEILARDMNARHCSGCHCPFSIMTGRAGTKTTRLPPIKRPADGSLPSSMP